MNPLLELKKLGQSVWYDNLRRGLIASGELKRMIEEYGLMGVTSNPTIFENAIAGTDEYDEDIAKLVTEGVAEIDILRRLMIKDIKLASEVMGPVFKGAGGRDGFVCIEVNPKLARDTKSTIDEARRLFSLIDKPNIMVKVPGTREGLAAIEELTYEGRSINVTLLFSVKRYEEVAWAYIKGLERRASEGLPIDTISSVASFFVSRVDTLADKMIEERAEHSTSNDEKARLKNLLGKVAIANARLAYIKFSEIFGSDRFRKLKDAGASPQRLLWASTGTKNPNYSDVKYVEGLIEKGTVNTMPLQTMLAFFDHGKVKPTLTEDLEGAKRIFTDLSTLGIDYDKLTERLEKDGIEIFSKSYDGVLESIKGKKEAILSKKGYTVKYALNGFEAPVSDALEEIEHENFLKRLWAKDPTLWKTTPEDKKLIKEALGWLNLPEIMEDNKDSIISFAAEIKKAGFTHAVLLGMGGSSLAPLVMNDAFGSAKGYPKLIVLDSTDPEAVKKAESEIDLDKTLFLVSSKSGSTIEPLSLFDYFYNKLKETHGEETGKNFIAITDPGTPLEGFSRKYKFRRLFLNPHDIGGRFSALSYFGLVPAALIGIDISKLIHHASCIAAATHPCMHGIRNPILMLGAALGILGRNGKDKVTFFMPDKLTSFGLWIEQLLAESTGKEGKGLVPVTREPIGIPDDYGNDRVFVNISFGELDKDMDKMLKDLFTAGHPVINFRLDDIHEVGGEFFRWEMATAVAGQLLGINPFDQPDVELAKKLTRERLNSIGKIKTTPPGVEYAGKKFNIYFGNSIYEQVKNGSSKTAMENFMGLLHEGDYLGMLAYFNPSDSKADFTFSGMRKKLRDMTKAATQFGYGPRYLHSTGQLHKGGTNKGVFIILCHDTKEDVKIPSSSFSFKDLELSQAFGDMEALDSKGCRVALLSLKDSSPETIAEAEKFILGAVKER
ncbi:MAG: bifunctional transaldolase/phosoglucose isomerase [Deltaproteobacteria bacterium]|nr:bifunctional transaldolase/phosoglucose isomerase [Deltaproteobacteria bacterium]